MASGWRHLLDVFFVVLITTAINTLFIGWFNQQPPSQTQRVSASSSSTPAPSELSSTPSPSVTPPATVPVVHRAVVGTRPQQTTKTKKPFYLVASPESNGNRFVVKLLVAAGCYGISGHEQPFDQKQRGGGDWPNHFRSAHVSAGCGVMHRSVPHAATWPNIPSLVQQIAAAGFQPRLLVVLRPEDAARESQVKQKHVRTVSDAQANILRAQRHIVDALASMPDVWFRLVLYEQLGHEHYLHWLFAEQMGLSLPGSHPKFEDRDSKHFH